MMMINESNVLTLRKVRLREVKIEVMTKEHDIKFKLPTDTRAIASVQTQIDEMMRGRGYGPRDLFRVRLCLKEALHLGAKQCFISCTT